MHVYIRTLIISASFLLVVNSQIQAQQESVSSNRFGGTMRKPADHWLESIREQDPDEYQRLIQIQKKSPDAFVAELRKRIQMRAVENLLTQNPILLDFVKGLAPAEQEKLMESFRNFTPYRKGRRAAGESDSYQDQRAAYREAKENRLSHQRRNGAPATTFSSTTTGKTRMEIETLYDQQTKVFENEITRISRQLQNLQRMLAERKSRRGQVINMRMQRISTGKKNTPPPSEDALN